MTAQPTTGPGSVLVRGPGRRFCDIRSGHRVAVADLAGRLAVVHGQSVTPPSSLAADVCSACEHPDWWEDPSVESRILDLLERALGHCSLLVADDDHVLVVTDAIGAVPWSAAAISPEAPPEALASSEALAAAATGRSGDLDPVSAEEWIATARVSAPWTLIRGVVRLWPGVVHRWHRSGWSARTYWSVPPVEPLQRADLGEAGERVRSELQYTSERIAAQHPRAVVLLSGGDDSRIVAASAAAAGVELRALTFVDADNRESAIARLVARRLRVDLRVVHRPADHAARAERWLSTADDALLDPSQAHSTELAAERWRYWTDETDAPLLDGYFAAALKTENVAVQQRSWWHLPLGPERMDVHGDAYDDVAIMWSDDPELAAAIRARHAAKVARLGHLPMVQRHEWSTLWPATDISAHTFAATNQLLGSSLSPLSMRPMIEAVAVVPARLRLNRELQRRAFAPLLGALAWLPRSDGEILALPPWPDTVATAADRLLFRTADRLRGQRSAPWATDAQMARSVDDLLDAATSEALTELGGRVPLARRLLAWRDGGRQGRPPTSHPSAATLRAIRLARHLAAAA